MIDSSFRPTTRDTRVVATRLHQHLPSVQLCHQPRELGIVCWMCNVTYNRSRKFHMAWVKMIVTSGQLSANVASAFFSEVSTVSRHCSFTVTHSPM